MQGIVLRTLRAIKMSSAWTLSSGWLHFYWEDNSYQHTVQGGLCHKPQACVHVQASPRGTVLGVILGNGNTRIGPGEGWALKWEGNGYTEIGQSDRAFQAKEAVCNLRVPLIRVSLKYVS